MSEIKENPSNTELLEEILESLEQEVFSKEDWIDNDFYKIPEITYSYKKEWNHLINETLFSKIWWLNIDNFLLSDDRQKEKIIIEIKEKLNKEIWEKIKKITNFIEEIESINTDDEILNARKNIILWWLKENINLLNLALEWLDFELEKAMIWLYFENKEKKSSSKFFINQNLREEKINKIEQLNTEVFWPKITNNKEYIEWNLDYLFEKFEDYKKLREENNLDEDRLLTEDEEKRYLDYISRLQNLSPDYRPKIRQKPKKVLDKKYYTREVNWEDLALILAHHSKWLDKQTWNFPHQVYFDELVSWVTDTPNWLLLPKNFKKLNKNYLDILRLDWHEIWQHWISQVIHEEIIWNIRWEKNLELVEGTAMEWEELFQNWANMMKEDNGINWNKVLVIDIEKISYVQSFSKTAMEEILSDEEFYDFLKLQDKIEPNKMSPLDRYLRFKRTGFQRKDITYTTWKIKAAKYINKVIKWEINGDVSDLFLWKIGFKQIPEFKKILKAKKIENPNLKLPENLLFAETLVFLLEQREKNPKNNKNKDIIKEKFLDYLILKYPFLKKDLVKEKIDSIRYNFKKHIIYALKIIEWYEGVYNNREKSKKILK